MASPIISKRAPAYADVPDEKWNDWRWQLSHRLNSAEEIEKVIPLSDSERKALQTSILQKLSHKCTEPDKQYFSFPLQGR